MNDVRLIELGAIEAEVKKSAAWFYWIAGLSLVNSIVVLSGSTFHFVVGLALADLGSGFYLGASDTPEKAVGIIFIVVATGLFALFGRQAGAMKKWAFITGMVIYALDGVIYAAFTEILPVLFHAFALFQIFRGYRRINAYVALQEDILNNPFVPTEVQPVTVSNVDELPAATAETAIDSGNATN